MSYQYYYEYLEFVIAVAKTAGTAIMQVYATDFEVIKKEDFSPLTQADIAAHQVIVTALSKLTPHIPILSEESEVIPYDTRKAWQTYWLIDPLDGTREFVKRNGEFTVNIALIDNHVPVMGVVYAPVTELLYFSLHGNGAYKQEKSKPIQKIHCKLLDIKQPVVAVSRSHADRRIQLFLQNLQDRTGVMPELINVGSSLKICLVAEGVADVYPRLGPTSEWDTAAGHCILKEAGGDIVDETGSALRYNSKDSLLNPFFFAVSSNEYDWTVYL
ncbi:3'(2'),5'-bisphosphate nucleotidase CysQ [mine drainage metagenome]|uniref:3'-phosphoadenosine 5'-phosphate phosphatase n=1 Tax=mine drainage metagenome TaxID=410659 RepID=A0A1J5T9X4_9ZZZZ